MSAINMGSRFIDDERDGGYTLDRDYNESDLGGISQEDVIRNGKTATPIPDYKLIETLERVRRSKATDLLAAWRLEDRDPFAMGGRKALISDEAVLTGLLLIAGEKGSLHLLSLSDLFQMRLSDQGRELLGLEAKRTAFAGNTRELKRWYHNTTRAFHRMICVMDPFPQDRRRSKTYTEIAEILKAHDKERERICRDRLNEFTHAFVSMTYRLQSRSLRRLSDRLDISFDQTFMQTPSKKGYSRKNLSAKIADERRNPVQGHRAPGPVDAFAGWHVRTGERSDFRKTETDTTTPDKTSHTNYAWGWEANLAVRVDASSPKRSRVPSLIVAANMSLPNMEVAEEAVSLMSYASRHGLKPGVADADKQYWANAMVERLHDPALMLGFTPSTDYRIDRLEPSGGQHGAKFLEGNAYCPGTPQNLLDATKDLALNKIDKVTFRERKSELGAYKLHVKETKPNGKTMLRCPALGPSPTVTCPLRELLKTVTDKQRPAVDEEDLPEILDTICKKHSATFDLTDLRREAQAFDYGTEEWEDFHKHARNSIESTNSQLKRGGDHNIHSSSRRLVRGFAAAQVMLTMVIAAFNIAKIAKFIHDRMHEDATGGPKEPYDRARDSVWYNPYTDSYPRGVTPPPGAKRRGRTDDGTGGPPIDG